MQDRSSNLKHPRDFNSRAFDSVARLTGTAPPDMEVPEDPIKAAAALLGRKGGLKGGAARAAKLTPKQRSASASKAAKARWAKKDKLAL